MLNLPAGILPLSPEAETLVASALYKAPKGSEPHALHWALALAEAAPDAVVAVLPKFSPSIIRRSVRQALKRGEVGPELPCGAVASRASAIAAGEGKRAIGPMHVAQAVADEAKELVESVCTTALVEASDEISRVESTPEPTGAEAAPEPSAVEPAGEPRAGPAPATPPGTPPDIAAFVRALTERVAEASRAASSSGSSSSGKQRPMLDQLAVDLTQMARDGKLAPVVGREAEMDLVLETLCKVTKRNPALVGQAGVGKTAIAEGVAKRIAEGNCPEMLRNARIYLLQPAALLAGLQSPPEYAQRVQEVIREASDPDVILFIDEFHSIMERGLVMEQDLVTLLKPALARGDIACIAATTDDEYRRIVESDTALSRRFQPIRIGEMGPDDTLIVLRAHAERLMHRRSVKVSEPVLRRIVNVTGDRMPNRRFPDKAVDVLEQAVAHAIIDGRSTVRLSDVTTVVERLTGAPADSAALLTELEAALERDRLLSEEEIETLIGKLKVSMAGLDIRPERPNAIILTLGGAASGADALSATIAESLAGSPARVVDIDFAFMAQPGDITRLIGAGPSYIGYGEELPIHALIQYPWSVLLCRNVDVCHPSVATALINALRRGVIVDGMGRSIRLCDCVVILTAGDERAIKDGGPIGLVRREPVRPREEPRLDSVRPELVELCTLIVTERQLTADVSLRYLETNLLPALAKRYSQHGLDVEFANGVGEWALRRFAQVTSSEALEDKAAAVLGERLLPYVPATGRTRVRVSVADGDLKVEKIPSRRTRP